MADMRGIPSVEPLEDVLEAEENVAPLTLAEVEAMFRRVFAERTAPDVAVESGVGRFNLYTREIARIALRQIKTRFFMFQLVFYTYVIQSEVNTLRQIDLAENKDVLPLVYVTGTMVVITLLIQGWTWAVGYSHRISKRK